MANLSKTGAQIINIVRNVTGRVDESDPLFTNTIMLGYINDFLNLEMPQEVRLYENKTWWEFTIDENTADPLPVDLEQLGYTTLGSTAYVDGFVLWWYQSPAVFYSIWPETQTYQPQRPQNVLYYNNTLTFRGPPDQEYAVKIMAYKVEPVLDGENSMIENAYFWRYVAYGAAIDIFNDYGEDDKVQKIMPAFERYKSMVVGRTNCQLQTQRTYPTF